MNEREINHLRKRFIGISTLSFFLVMLLMGGLIYGFSEMTLRAEIRQIMDYLVENEGEILTDSSDAVNAETSGIEEAENGSTSAEEEDNFDEQIEWSLQRLFGRGNVIEDTQDFVYSTTYFAVLYDGDGQVEEIKTHHMKYMDEETAGRLADIALHRVFAFGSFGRYYYCVEERDSGGSIVIYLDRTGEVSINNRILFAAMALLGLGSILAFFLMRLFSKRIVRAEIENAARQKEFITNASHELKTPLAVIRANTEMQEMLSGETEWTASTMRQVERMQGLIGNLVMIARSSESEGLEIKELSVAEPVRETADTFAPVASSEGKTLEKKIADDLYIMADESKIRQLTSLLIDNAVKYCDEGGTILVETLKQGKHAEIAVSNHYAKGENTDYKRFFDRFYREDSAHNMEKGGYGIGLSMAESIVKSLDGTISVSWKAGMIRFVCSFRAVNKHTQKTENE